MDLDKLCFCIKERDKPTNHLTKTVVTAFGNDEGWDAELGLKTEIVPISKPFGLYAGNVFQGVVTMDGQPVPFAEVEVEYYNREKRRSPRPISW
jgi:cobalt/nickel transport protein